MVRAGGVRFLLLLGLATAAIVGVSAVRASGRPATYGAPASPPLEAYLVASASPAPAIELTDPDGRRYSLASKRGSAVLVFFGYTHCEDVCPATVGIVSEVMGRVGSGIEAVYVTVDPERDTQASLKEYVRYLPPGFAAVTGTADAIRRTADAWGVRYARVDTGPGHYSMTHSTDVYLVDSNGLLRATFPFGTEPEAMS